jgi:predicted adenine nucleotide alpha hydrolase (AANH) superfamily ATPase
MKIALHICCGICAGGAAERLKVEGHEITGFFYNPNIHPPDEYTRRLDATRTVARALQFPLVVPVYNPAEWEGVAGHERGEPEGGARCAACYRLRLTRTARFLAESGLDAMTTTLTMGSRKRASVVNGIGSEIAGDRFLGRDFKKQNGFARASELASQWDLYRQPYCGCRYSVRQPLPGPR